MHIMPAQDYYKSLLKRGEEDAMPNCCCCDGEHPASEPGPFVVENGVVKKLDTPQDSCNKEIIVDDFSVPKEFEQAYLGDGHPESSHEES